ncbi:MAG: hypothetical protein J3Q66DRAFT_331260 [Benniella sp.]|nr:MAG: hypothetical protein J3Q66DRAFT_331260 [Benniella sp.]
MPRITSLHVDFSQDAFKMDFASLLQPHFSNLRDLVVKTEECIASPLAQVVMSSCPMLESLCAPFVDAHVVTEGKPWVCSNLKALVLRLCFSSASSVSHLQPLVFDRLSKLTRLQDLCMAGGFEDEGPDLQHGVVDLRIDYGLGKLSTLRRLYAFTIWQMDQRMGDPEVDWILEHWRSLTIFTGSLNTDPAVDQALRERLKGHGISE